MVVNRDLTPLFALHPPTKLSEWLRLMRKVNFSLMPSDIWMEMNTALFMKTDHVGFMHYHSSLGNTLEYGSFVNE